MNPKLTFATVAIFSSVAVAAAGAQARGDAGRQRGEARQSPRVAAAPQRAVPRQAVPRAAPSRQYETPHVVPRGPGAGAVVPRGPGRGAPVPRYVQPRDNRGAYAPPRYVRPYAYVPYRPYHFPRPYYSFRPRWNIGFGLWIGSPVPYPWSYFGGYVPRVYGYYNVLPGVQSYCGLSFDIQPSDAALYVDGEYVGIVGDFTPYGEPLTVVPGVHSVSIIHDGYRPLEFEVTIAAGEVIPYRGVMVQY